MSYYLLATNLDCWNEFLQINTNENTNTTNNTATATVNQQQGVENVRQEDCKQQMQMQLQQQRQNIIINAVPLITIQTTPTSNNKNVLIPTLNNQQQQQQQQQLTQQHQNQQQSNTKSLTKVNTIKLTPITSTATIKIIENKPQALGQQQPNIIKTAYIQATPAAAGTVTAVLNNINNKRHMSHTQINNNNALESKRLKSNIMDYQQNSTTTSQLLQQLITTPQQQQPGNLHSKNSKGVLESRWPANENQTLTQQQQQKQQKQSNSVLKNLLISGCDVSAGYCILPMRPKTKLAKA